MIAPQLAAPPNLAGLGGLHRHVKKKQVDAMFAKAAPIIEVIVNFVGGGFMVMQLNGKAQETARVSENGVAVQREGGVGRTVAGSIRELADLIENNRRALGPGEGKKDLDQNVKGDEKSFLERNIERFGIGGPVPRDESRTEEKLIGRPPEESERAPEEELRARLMKPVEEIDLMFVRKADGTFNRVREFCDVLPEVREHLRRGSPLEIEMALAKLETVKDVSIFGMAPSQVDSLARGVVEKQLTVEAMRQLVEDRVKFAEEAVKHQQYLEQLRLAGYSDSYIAAQSSKAPTPTEAMSKAQELAEKEIIIAKSKAKPLPLNPGAERRSNEDLTEELEHNLNNAISHELIEAWGMVKGRSIELPRGPDMSEILKELYEKAREDKPRGAPGWQERDPFDPRLLDPRELPDLRMFPPRSGVVDS